MYVGKALKSISYTREKRHPLSLKSVGQLATTAAAGLGQGHIQPEGEIGLQIACGQRFQHVKQGHGPSPAMALVCGG